MEENIKILEGYLDRNTQLFEDYGENAIIQDKEIQALENLIKGYRELEVENKAYEEGKIFTNEQIKVIKENTIPKSKVKELHKEYYEKAFAEPYDCTTADYKHSQAIGGWIALNKLLMED